LNSFELLAGIFFEGVIEFAADLLSALAVRTFEWLLDRGEIATPLFASRSSACAGRKSSQLRPLSLNSEVGGGFIEIQ
jgi:hypothetical protein